MGARKHIAAEKLKEARKNLYFAKLVGVPSSPRKMRYVVDMIRGMEVNRALGVLRFSKKQAFLLMGNRFQPLKKAVFILFFQLQPFIDAKQHPIQRNGYNRHID